MKKFLFIAVAGLSIVAFASCSGKKDAKEVAETTPDTVENTVKTVAYTGVIPAADCDGNNYALNLVFNEEDNGGTFQLSETYFNTDTTTAEGYTVIDTFTSEGNFEVKSVEDNTYITLFNNEAVAQANFIVDTDSTITMVNAELEVPSTPGYTLAVVK